MKKLAKLLSVLLTVAMLFSLMACTTTPENPDNGENNGENNNQENTNKALYAELADKFVTGTLTQLESAKSIKFTVDMNMEMSEDYEGDEYDFAETQDGSAEVTVSEIDGKLAIYVRVLAKYGADEYVDSDFTEVNENATWIYDVDEFILKDGYSYERSYQYFDVNTDAEIEAKMAATHWTRDYDTTGITEISFSEAVSVLKEALDGETLTALKEEVATQLEASGSTDGKLTLTYDMAPRITEILDYLKSVKTTDTVRKVVNTTLAEIDPELTVDKIITLILLYDTQPLNQAVANIEAYTVSEGMGTLQEMWNKLIASKGFEMLATMLGMPEEVMAQMAAFRISDLLSAYGEYTVADIIYTLIASQSIGPDYDPGDEGYFDGSENGNGEFDGEFDELEPAPEPEVTPGFTVMKAPQGFIKSLVENILPIFDATTFSDMGTDIYGFIYNTFGLEIDEPTKAKKLALTVSAEFDTESGAVNAMAISADIDVDVVDVEYYGDILLYKKLKKISNIKVKANCSVQELIGDDALINATSSDMIENDFDVPFDE